MRDRGLYVSRGGRKLEFALRHFEIDPKGAIAADFGSHIGGFVDCLLRFGAERVYSIDTAYGTLAWRLRQDGRVVVMERTNALHVSLPEPVDVVTIDVGWTPQRLIVPRALEAVRPGGTVLSLVKPQYEAHPGQHDRGIVPEARLDDILARVESELAQVGSSVAAWLRLPEPTPKGNPELFALFQKRYAG